MRKTICIFLIAAFLWTMQLAAAPTTPVENGSGAVEKVGSPAPAVKKSPLVPIIIGVVAVAAIAAVLILVVFKTKYDITGTWNVTIVQSQDQNSWTAVFFFSGSKSSGTGEYREPSMNFPGTYTVNGKQVTINFDLSTFISPTMLTFSGSFSDASTMSGTWTSVSGGSGTWSAKKS